MAEQKVQTKQTNWLSEVEHADPGARQKDIVVYEFSNGLKKYEPFNPDGRGIYE